MLVSQIDDFEVFVRVVTAGNMSAAARDMGISPAVISKRISGMEDRLGVRLFQRTTRHVQLTEAGAGFYERVVAILASIEEAEAYVSHGRDEARGVLKISAPTSFSRRHLAPHIPQFLKRYPHVTLDLQTSDAIVDIISEGIDIAIRVAEITDTSLAVHKLAPCRRVLCAAPAFLARHGVPKTIEDISPKSCITFNTHAVWRLHGPGGGVAIRPSSQLRTNSSEVVRESVIAGLGFGLRSTWDIYHELKAGTLKIVLPDYGSSSDVAVYAVHPSKDYIPAKLCVFLDYLSEVYAHPVYWEKGLDLSLAAAAVD